MSESEEWAALCLLVGRREAIRLANWEEFSASPRWWEFPLYSPDRMRAWMDAQEIDAMCQRISRGRIAP